MPEKSADCNPSQDERLVSALAHITILLPLIGIIAPIVIYVTQREKSKFIGFQALQALAYQLVLLLGWLLGMACYLASFGLTFGGVFLTLPLTAAENNPEMGVVAVIFTMLASAVPFLIFGIMFLGGLLLAGYGFVAAVLVFQGRNFHYLLIGRWVENYLNKENPAD